MLSFRVARRFFFRLAFGVSRRAELRAGLSIGEVGNAARKGKGIHFLIYPAIRTRYEAPIVDIFPYLSEIVITGMHKQENDKIFIVDCNIAPAQKRGKGGIAHLLQ